MEKGKLYMRLYWIVFIAAMVTLYFSLRSDLYALEYSVASLALWGVAFYINRLLKKENDED